jgi:NAD-dependent SIR2 family protein deacetylase
MIFSGAGISVAAGLPAFRGTGGLYHAKGLPYSHGYDGNIEDLFSLPVLMVSILLLLCSKN